MRTVTRSQLIRAAEQTLTLVKPIIDVSEEDEHCYMEVARQADLITKDWEADQVEYPTCGCLVGTLNLKRNAARGGYPLNDSQETVGGAFPECFDEVTGLEGELREVFRVVED